jgi:hypothetical protein
MAQSSSPTHPISDNSPTAGTAPSVLVFAGAGLGGLAVLGTLALWFQYGTSVFFETIRTGLSTCF